MKKLTLAAVLWLLALFSGAACAEGNSLIITQRNSADTGNILRTLNNPSTDGILIWSKATALPAYLTIGTGLTVSNGVLSAAVQPSQVNADWNAASGAAQILNKPALKTVAITGQAADLTGLAPVALSGAWADITGKPAIPAAQVGADWAATTGVSAILNKPTFAPVAMSGSYADLTNKPTIPAAPLPRAFAYRAPALNTCFQLSATRDVQVSYSVDVTASLSLLGGARGSVYLRTYSDSACTIGQQTITSGSSGLPAALAVAVGLQNLGSVALPAVVPAGAWARIETVNDQGTPTFSARPGQEVAL